MPVFMVPVLWASGAIVVLGGGYYLIHAGHLFH
jgi:hypothetical protein